MPAEALVDRVLEHQVPAAMLANIGNVALNNQEGFVLALASYGGTVDKVAEILSCEPKDIRHTRDSVIEKFDALNMAGTVNKAIQSRILPVEVKSDGRAKKCLLPRERTILQYIADGHSNSEIAKKLGKSTGTVASLARPIYKKLQASGRTHSVRRAYELGIFTLPEID